MTGSPPVWMAMRYSVADAFSILNDFPSLVSFPSVVTLIFTVNG